MTCDERDFKASATSPPARWWCTRRRRSPAARAITQAPAAAAAALAFAEEQRAVLDLAERSAKFTRERFEELAECHAAVAARVRDAAADAHAGHRNYLAGK